MNLYIVVLGQPPHCFWGGNLRDFTNNKKKQIKKQVYIYSTQGKVKNRNFKPHPPTLMRRYIKQ